MRRIESIGVAATAGLMIALACGDETSPTGDFFLSLALQPHTAQPGDTIRATVTAFPPGGDVVDVIRLSATGLITAEDSLHFSGRGPQSHTWTYVLPYLPAAGQVIFTATATAHGEVLWTLDTLPVADTLPPEVTALNATPIVLLPADTVTVTYSAQDAEGVVDESLFDGGFNLLRTFSSSRYTLGGSSALSADGLSAYLGYLKAQTIDGVVVDTVRTGQTFDRFIAVSSGSWLVGVAGNPQLGAERLVLMDLR